MRTVWIIAANAGLRSLLAAAIRQQGGEAVGFETAGDAIEALLSGAPSAIVVDPHGQPEGLVERLRAAGPPLVLARDLASIAAAADAALGV
jgi:DNA-binding NtrC family response regulator